jgi:hypothetical protein
VIQNNQEDLSRSQHYICIPTDCAYEIRMTILPPQSIFPVGGSEGAGSKCHSRLPLARKVSEGSPGTAIPFRDYW